MFASVGNNGQTLVVANYHGPDDAKTSDGASVATFQINRDDCSLTQADVKPHSGHSVNPARQGGAHVHSTVAARDGLVYACDLGMDEIFTYSLAANGTLTELARTSTPQGAGPRHLVQHPQKDFIYVVTEMGQSVLSYKQMKNGALKLVVEETLVYSELGNGTGSKAAEIAISPDGAFVFATNRGSQNTVTVFQTQEDGTLVNKGHYDAPRFPRGMALVQVDDDQVLLVGGQSKTEVWSYLVGQDGNLTHADKLENKKVLAPHVSTFTSFQQYSPLEEVVV